MGNDDGPMGETEPLVGDNQGGNFKALGEQDTKLSSFLLQDASHCSLSF
jgi:hypothetical protein